MKDLSLAILADPPNAAHVLPGLAVDYTPAQRATIAEFLIRATVELAVASWPGPVYLYGAPDIDHPLFAMLADTFQIELVAQAPGACNVRMAAALADLLTRAGAAGVVPCNVPHCPWDVLDDANHWLARGRTVIGPTDSGALWFVGLPRAHAHLAQALTEAGSRALDALAGAAARDGVELDALPHLRPIGSSMELWLAAQQSDALKQFLDGLKVT